MDSFEWNKIAGAVLFALLLSVGVKVLSDTLFETEAPESPGYVIAVATEEGDEGGGAAAPQPIAVLLASADPQAGESSARKCVACHTFGSGEPNKVGPNLWGIVNRPIASHEGFEYDDAMRQYAEQAQTWTFEHLNTFLHDPKATVPGTKMAFAGLKNDQERANVIAYLRTLSDNPVPLPEPPTDAASAEGGETDVASAAPAEATAETPAAMAEAPAEEAPAEAAPEGEQPAAEGEAAADAEAPAAPEAPAATEAPAAAPAAAAAAGDVAKGETFSKRCTVCHSFAKDGPNQVGPHLYGVVGRPIASVPDYAYSDAMKAFSENGTKAWDEAALDAYLSDPRGVVPGTKMIFPGINSEADRANVIAYLRTLAE